MLSKHDHWFQLAILSLQPIILVQLLKNGGSFLNFHVIPATIVDNLQYNILQLAMWVLQLYKTTRVSNLKCLHCCLIFFVKSQFQQTFKCVLVQCS